MAHGIWLLVTNGNVPHDLSVLRVVAYLGGEALGFNSGVVVGRVSRIGATFYRQLLRVAVQPIFKWSRVGIIDPSTILQELPLS